MAKMLESLQSTERGNAYNSFRNSVLRKRTNMTAKVRKQGDSSIIALDGRLALGAPVDDLRSHWTEALAGGAKNLIINLANVTMVDSSGIGTMIRCHSAVAASGGKLKVVGANTTVRQAFKITRLDQVFEFHETEESALR